MTITYSTEQVTQEMAARWLSVNTGNRPVSKGSVARFAADIKNDRWMETADPIKLAEGESRLVDGQHRCLAIVSAKKAITTAVARGVSPDTFVVQDCGKKRTPGDTFHVAGFVDTNILSSAVRKALMLMSGLAPRHSHRNIISTHELMDYMEENKDAFEAAMRTKHRMVGIMPASLCVAMRFVLGIIDDERASIFFDTLSTGIGLQEGNSVYTLRERLRKIMSERGTRKHGDETLIAHITIKAWNHFVAGNRCMVLGVRQTEPFPSLLDQIPEEFHRVV